MNQITVKAQEVTSSINLKGCGVDLIKLKLKYHVSEESITFRLTFLKDVSVFIGENKKKKTCNAFYTKAYLSDGSKIIHTVWFTPNCFKSFNYSIFLFSYLFEERNLESIINRIDFNFDFNCTLSNFLSKIDITHKHRVSAYHSDKKYFTGLTFGYNHEISVYDAKYRHNLQEECTRLEFRLRNSKNFKLGVLQDISQTIVTILKKGLLNKKLKIVFLNTKYLNLVDTLEHDLKIYIEFVFLFRNYGYSFARRKFQTSNFRRDMIDCFDSKDEYVDLSSVFFQYFKNDLQKVIS